MQSKEWVYTKLQRVTLRREDGPVDIFHQSSAFPPNYIHSLDSSHMMMTALRCSQLGGTRPHAVGHPASCSHRLVELISALLI